MPQSNLIVDAGEAYNKYTLALVALAIALDIKDDTGSEQRRVNSYAENLRYSLSLLGIDQEIPTVVGGADEIRRFIMEQELQLKISDKITRQISQEQGLIFTLTCLICVIFSKESLHGESRETEVAKPIAFDIGRKLRIPERIIEECFEMKNTNSLRDYIQGSTLEERMGQYFNE